MKRLIIEFENSDVLGRFIDGICDIPNMKGVTIIPDEPPPHPTANGGGGRNGQ